MTVLPLMFAIYVGEDDHNLAERLKRREPAAMAELYDRYGTLAYSLHLSRRAGHGCGGRPCAGDFFARVESCAGFDASGCALGPWLLAVARNRAIDYVRSSAGGMARGFLELAYA